MEELKYIIEDATIAELLGNQNFINEESAVLELLKNAYDAKATIFELSFDNNRLIAIDNGSGMDANDIKRHWMHVGKSEKQYEITDAENNKRILAGSMGIGRFALAKLGKDIQVLTKKEKTKGVVWCTDWNSSHLEEEPTLIKSGTKIVINSLREKWGKKRVENLRDFLSKTYNDNLMKVSITYHGENIRVTPYFPTPVLGKNCLSNIIMKFDSANCKLFTEIYSDEFLQSAKNFCPNIDLNEFNTTTDIVDELKSCNELDLSILELKERLNKLGNFKVEMFFNIDSTATEMDKFLYKYSKLPENLKGGVILFRNAFSISSYEGKKDWLGLGKRSRKSPAAASHPTGAWRVRENQLSGKVEIDKRDNEVLQDLSNRQGLDENIYYQIFIEIILVGLKEFERYRQSIIRSINVKNDEETANKATPISDKVVSNPAVVSKLSAQEAKQLATEIKTYRKESDSFKREKANVEERYKYDVRILNVLATTGLKASSIAHEMRNDRNAIADNDFFIVEALKEYDMWEELQSPEKTEKAYRNVPLLIKSNSDVSAKIVAFMNTMLLETEKKQFIALLHNISELLIKIKNTWERDYAWISITIKIKENIFFEVSEDIIRVIFDNLILNSIQQNVNRDHLNINIIAKEFRDSISFEYIDDGKGLDVKYHDNTRKILEVHETTRKDGHGLGMWIVNNTIVMSGGEILRIEGEQGFFIEFYVGGKM